MTNESRYKDVIRSRPIGRITGQPEALRESLWRIPHIEWVWRRTDEKAHFSAAVPETAARRRTSAKLGGQSLLYADAVIGTCDAARSSAGPVFRLKFSAQLIKPT